VSHGLSKPFRVEEKGPAKVVVPLGGSSYVEENTARKAILRILWLYGYLAGSSLGSRGAFKLVHGKYGDVVPTGKIYLLLEEASKENPIVELIWETARSLWRQYGDGVKTAILLAFKLYEEAYKLMVEYGLRPSVILEGYAKALRIHLKTLEDLASKSPRLSCIQAARSILWGSQARDILAGLLCRALSRYSDKGCSKPFTEAVDFERVEGGSLSDSFLFEGVVVRKRISRPGMPRVRRGPLRVVVVDQKIYTDLRYEGYTFIVDNPDLALRLREEASRLHEWVVRKLEGLGVGFIVNVKGIDAAVEEALERRGILALRRIPPEKARLMAAASNARILSRLQDVEPGDVGLVDSVEERVYGDRYYTFIKAGRGCVSTLVIRGPWYAVDTVYQEARMAARGLEAFLGDPRGLPAGGAPEVEAAVRILEASRTAPGKIQLAMEAYARALEVIPRTLARHSALDPEEALANLESLHNRGLWAAGVDEFEGEIVDDVTGRGLLDLYAVRRAASEAGASLAAGLLRVTGIAVHKRGEYLRAIREPHR